MKIFMICRTPVRRVECYFGLPSNEDSFSLALPRSASFSEVWCAGFSRSAFERCVAAYLGEVLVKNRPPFEWFVAEDPFEPGKYEVGVRRPLYSLMLTLPLDLATRPNNKRRQSLWREYRQHAA